MNPVEKTLYQKEIEKNRAAAKEPHYKFVQFLTAACAGMLSLSAPLQSSSTYQNLPHGYISLFALCFLSASVVAGAVALYGDKNGHDRIAKEMELIRKKHGGNEFLAHAEVNEKKEAWIKPPAIHRRAFHGQWIFASLGVLLLLLSKALPLVHCSTNISHHLPITGESSAHEKTEPPKQ